MKASTRAYLAATALLVGTMHASADTGGLAAAEVFFDEGTKLLLEKKYEEGCPKLEQSLALDPAGGTLQNLAVCYEGWGKIATAYARFQDLRSMSKAASPPRTDRVQFAEQHIAELAPRLSRVELIMAQSNRPAKPVVTIDGVVYAEAAWSGIVIDPGPHELVVTAPKYDTFRTSMTVSHEHTRLRVNVPPLVLSPVQEAASVSPHAGLPLRTAGYVTASAGLAVAAAGGVFGILAMTTNSAANGHCDSNECRPGDPGRAQQSSRANDLRADARVFANVSNVALPVGLVAAAVGSVLVWQGFRIDRRSSAQAWRVTPSLGSVSLSGSF